jgi:hypothetical protein
MIESWEVPQKWTTCSRSYQVRFPQQIFYNGYVIELVFKLTMNTHFDVRYPNSAARISLGPEGPDTCGWIILFAVSFGLYCFLSPRNVVEFRAVASVGKAVSCRECVLFRMTNNHNYQVRALAVRTWGDMGIIGISSRGHFRSAPV